MENNIYGRFTKKDGFIYRTDTYIQIGDSEEIMGACVLCNPGSSRLLDMGKQRELEDYEGEILVRDIERLFPDDTMKQLIKILEGVGLDKKDGRFHIYNIFTLRNGNMDSAIREMKEKDIDDDLLYRDYEDFKVNKDNIPWTIVGWGCKSERNLNGLKREWLEYLEGNSVNFIGDKHDNDPHYYHPRPRTKQDQEEYVKELIVKLNDLLKNEI